MSDSRDPGAEYPYAFVHVDTGADVAPELEPSRPAESVADAYARGRRDVGELGALPGRFGLAEIRAVRYSAAVATSRAARAYWFGVARAYRETERG